MGHISREHCGAGKSLYLLELCIIAESPADVQGHEPR